MIQTKQELAYALEKMTKAFGELKKATKAIGKIIKEMEKEEPRFLLDKNSICYGCPEYKNIMDCDLTDPWNHWGEGDENGGVCDTEVPCYDGDRNTYKKKETEEDMLARKCDRCGMFYGIEETAEIRRKKVRESVLRIHGVDKRVNERIEGAFDLCPDCVNKLLEWLKERGQNEDL